MVTISGNIHALPGATLCVRRTRSYQVFQSLIWVMHSQCIHEQIWENISLIGLEYVDIDLFHSIISVMMSQLL
jgi:hypothetical protein